VLHIRKHSITIRVTWQHNSTDKLVIGKSVKAIVPRLDVRCYELCLENSLRDCFKHPQTQTLLITCANTNPSTTKNTLANTKGKPYMRFLGAIIVFPFLRGR